MNLSTILDNYETVLLDQISADKVDETINLRLPRTAIIQEVTAALSSLSYVSEKVTYAKPPTYAMLNLLLHAPDYKLPAEGFRESVVSMIKELTNITEQFKSLSGEKNYLLYCKILKRAWENDGSIDKNESGILELIRSELGIWLREHFVLAHHPEILSIWDIEQEYFVARNAMLATGIILTQDDHYMLAEEVALQVKRSLGMEIDDNSYKRLLNGLNKEDLSSILNNFRLPISGSKDDLISRLINAMIPPFDLLNVFHIEALREICRQNGITVSGIKSTVISNIVTHFDSGNDLDAGKKEEPEILIPVESEPKEMPPDIYSKVLLNLSNQQLYDILYKSYLPTSGSKEEKVIRIVDSNWAERSILNQLRKEDIAQLCRKNNLLSSGSKQQLLDRIIDLNPTAAQVNEIRVIEPESDLKNEVTISEIPIIKQSFLNSSLFFQVVQKDFPELNEDEQVVVALLQELKTLTEYELERVVGKYGLKWILHKAEMAEIIAKLKRNNKRPIRIKSVQGNNIYQWIENDLSEVVMEKKMARDIVDALRNGVVPKHNLDLLMVGQDNARGHLSQIMSELNHSKSHFKFIRGQYGSGKTFLCSWLKEYALDNEFAVSFLNISHDQPLSDLPVFFSGMINGLRTPEKTDSSALEDILESWLLNIHKKTVQIEGLSGSNENDIESIVERQIENEFANFNDIEPGFSQALRSFYKGKVSGNAMLASNAMAWITGSRSLSAQALREIGVKGVLEENNVFHRMRVILELISGARYKGLLLLVDELELVRKFPHARQREQAFEILRLLIDEVGKNAMPSCFVVFTGTDEFFDDERYGLKSYEALAERVLTPLQHHSFVSMRQPIISIEALDKARLANVIYKVRDLYGLAYNWDAKSHVNDESVSKLIENWTMFGDESINRRPRPVLRELIHILDLCEENKGLSVTDFITNNQPGSLQLMEQFPN